jgi:hypothetical protein
MGRPHGVKHAFGMVLQSSVVVIVEGGYRAVEIMTSVVKQLKNCIADMFGGRARPIGGSQFLGPFR